ncbi:Replication protein O [Peribacillus frigoritolerans]|uniref:Replication protein O n=1 Tax=Peribacillus frigoritolerans TaxID=450367 RepID=UPI0021D20250|nr:Replication protein O [Peribacillus frigoritolerans]MCU6603787.1 Replication protein O [Peribacillus frigoritolerans]
MHRKIQTHWLYEEERVFSKFEAWIDILLMVNHEPKKILFDGDFIEVQKGQRITSIRQLGEKWKWSRTKVSDFIKLLEQDGMITTVKDSRKTLLTVVNYGFYQNEDIEKRHSNDTEKPLKSTNNNDNNENNENKSKNTSRQDQVKKYKFDEKQMALAELLWKYVQQNVPSQPKPNLKSWANTFRLMMERDEISGKDIQEIIIWATNHHFWFKNILSADKLRKQFSRLSIEMKSEDNHLNVIKGGKKADENIESSYGDSDYSKYNFR